MFLIQEFLEHLRDCGTMAVTSDHIYIAAGQTALGFKVEDGDQDITLEVPQVVKGQESKWGYLAIVGRSDIWIR